MMTYLKYVLSVNKNAPMNVQVAVQDLYEKCKRYSIDETLKLVLMPIDSMEYPLVMEFIEKYREYAYRNVFYKHEFTKKEIDNAEYYRLGTKSIVCVTSTTEHDLYCCDKKSFFWTIANNFKIGRKDMGNKLISFTSVNRFIVTPEVKERIEESDLQNFAFFPVLSKTQDEILAWQIETKELLPSLKEINGWRVETKCPNCGKQNYEGLQIYDHTLYIPLSMKENLKDINATQETFSGLQARYYIISKRVYNLLKELGAKNLSCQPIVFK